MLPVPHLRLVLTCQGPEEEVAAQAVELRGQYPDHQLGLPQSPFRPRGRGRTSQPKIWLPGLATITQIFFNHTFAGQLLTVWLISPPLFVIFSATAYSSEVPLLTETDGVLKYQGKIHCQGATPDVIVKE